MEGKDLMMAMETERTNSYFHELNKSRIDIAYEIKSYLDAEEGEEKAGAVLDLFLIDKHKEAIDAIMENVSIESASWYDTLHSEAVKFSIVMLTKYRGAKITSKAKRRAELLKELDSLG